MPQSDQSAHGKLGKLVKQALKDWHSTDQGKNTLADLYLYRDVQRDERLLPREASNMVLQSGLAQLHHISEKDAELLEARFMDRASIQNLSYRYNVAESTVYTMQKDAVNRLVNILELREQEASSERKALLRHRLEAATYERLVGIEAIEEVLLSKIVGREPPWFVSLEGIGGIGKTSLAHKLLTDVIESGTFSEIGWVSARQRHLNLGGAIGPIAEPALSAESLIERLLFQLLPEFASPSLDLNKQLRALQRLLKDIPHLIVVDNLETLVDVEALLPTLQKLTNPSRFILTSRESLYAGANVFHFAVPELQESDALALIRQEAALSNLPELAESTNEEILPIFQAVGGNPLALRLIVGQNHIHPLGRILDDVASASTPATQSLYTYVYEQAWQSLDPLAQQVLKLFPMANPSGEEIDNLADAGGLSVDEIRSSLNHLVRLNLVDARGGLTERRYSIHGLTRAFLHERVLGWMG